MKLTFTLAFLLLSIISFAQPEGIRIGDPYDKVPGKRFTFQDGYFGLCVTSEKKSVTIQKFDLRTNLEAAVFTFKDLLAGFYVEEVLKLNGKYFLFYSLADKKAGIKALFAREIFMETGRLSDDTKELFVVETVTPWMQHELGFNMSETSRQFSLRLSNNHKHLAVAYQVKKEKKKDKTTHYGIKYLDESLAVKSTTTTSDLTIPGENWMMDFAVSNEGVVLFNMRNKIEGEGKTYSVQSHLWTINNGKSTFAQIENDDKECINAKFISTSNSTYLTSFYLNATQENTRGLILNEFDQAGAISKTNKYPFPDELNIPYGLGKIMGKTLNTVAFEETEDGDLILVAEENSTDISAGGALEVVAAATGSAAFPTNYSKQICILKLNKALELQWVRRIRKSQKHAQSDLNLSFATAYDDGKLMIVVNDELPNSILKPEYPAKVFTGGSGGHVILYDVMGRGTIKAHDIGEVSDIRGLNLSNFDKRTIYYLEDHFILEMDRSKKESALLYFKFE
jgi:hypothetical protein